MRKFARLTASLAALLAISGAAFAATPAHADEGPSVEVRLRCDGLTVIAQTLGKDQLAAGGGMVSIDGQVVALGGAAAGNSSGNYLPITGAAAGALAANESGYTYAYVIDDSGTPASVSSDDEIAKIEAETDMNGKSKATVVIKYNADGKPVSAYVIVVTLTPDGFSYSESMQTLECSFVGPSIPKNKDGTIYEQKLIVCEVAVFNAPLAKPSATIN